VKTSIDPTTEIHPTAYVNPENVIIEKNVIIGPLSAVGINGLFTARDYIVTGKKHRKDLKGQLIIRENSDIGALNAIVLGSEENDQTIIDKNVLIGNCNSIGHDSFIGEETIVTVNTTILGHVVIGRKCRIGPGAIIRERIKVGDGAIISMGAVVTQDVEPGKRVTGNFAIDHDLFLTDLKEKISQEKS